MIEFNERSSLVHLVLEDGFIRERSEAVSCALVELVLELNPMESEGVQEALKSIHAHQHKECE